MFRLMIPAVPILIAHTIVGLFVLWLLMVNVPAQMAVFDDFGASLPPATVLLGRISELMVAYWYIIVPVFATVDCVAVFGLQQFRERQSWLVWAWFAFWLFLAVVLFAFAALAIYSPMARLMQELACSAYPTNLLAEVLLC